MKIENIDVSRPKKKKGIKATHVRSCSVAGISFRLTSSLRTGQQTNRIRKIADTKPPNKTQKLK